jgi:phosphonopyruvate decarboxylase
VIEATELARGLVGRGFGRFAGVPCSHLDGLIQVLSAEGRYVAAADEGAALAIAAGSQLSGQRAGVLIQNSGLGNLVNPLTSLLIPFRIPVLVFATLRGWPDAAGDEPQHSVMGRVTAALLEEIGVPHRILDPEATSLDFLFDFVEDAFESEQPAFVLVPRGAVTAGVRRPAAGGWSTPEALADLVPLLSGRTVFATTGYLSRHLHALGDRAGTFYMQGAMGHALALGLGAALASPEESVVVLDGDGALLMHLGTASTVGALRPRNLVHVVFDNGAYESTGGQPTTSGAIDWRGFAESVGYRAAFLCRDPEELAQRGPAGLEAEGPVLLVLEVGIGSGAPPPRATAALEPAELTRRFSARAVAGG